MSTQKRTLAVLGAGNIGGTLGKKWSAAGHQVVFGVSDPNSPKAQALRQELGANATVGLVAEALASNPDVVIIAVPGKVVDQILQEHAAQLDNKTIIDTANRMGETTLHSIEEFEKHAPGARVFRAFNSLGWENFADPYFNGVQADLFYCGPSGEARDVVEALISDIGLRPMYLGGPDKVGLVDSVAQLWFTLAFGQGKGRHLAFKVLS
jgi:8-hydroxy-5-deazaflavin:NADPH oxidoreductase